MLGYEIGDNKMDTLTARWALLTTLDSMAITEIHALEKNLAKQNCACCDSPWFIIGLNEMQSRTPRPFWDKKKEAMEREQEIQRFETEAKRAAFKALYDTSKLTDTGNPIPHTQAIEERKELSRMRYAQWMDCVEDTHLMDDAVLRTCKINRTVTASGGKASALWQDK